MNFGWQKKTVHSSSYPILLIDWLLFLLCLGMISLGSIVHSVLTSGLEKRLEIAYQVGIAVSGIDKDVASLMRGSKLRYDALRDSSSSSQRGGEVVLHSVLTLSKKYFPNSLLGELATYHEDIVMDLAGVHTPQSYVFVLQNTNEARPNGGFFGSYAHVTFSGGVLDDIEFRDSYVPGFDRPGIGIEGPEWLLNMMPTSEIHFVGANKIGFTYADGGHIKKLYELAYPNETIRGVLFVRLDSLQQLLPQIQQSVTKRQFINAMANELPSDSWKKKSLYLQNIQEEFTDSLIPLFGKILRNEDDYTQLIDIYLEDIPGDFHSFLKKKNLTTRFDTAMMYAWDSNISFSKTDGFVEKDVICKEVGCSGEDCPEYQGNERINLDTIPSGIELICKKIYTFEIPESYFDELEELENEYGVQLGTREQHILGVTKTWGTRGSIYLSDHREISGLTGDIYEGSVFSTPFGQGITYKIRMEDEGTRSLEWTMKKIN